MDEEKIYQPEGPGFIERITGENGFGQPACSLMLRLGAEEETLMLYEAGPVYFQSRDFGEIFLVDLQFPENRTEAFRRTLEMLEQFVDSVDQTTGEYNRDRMLSAIFMENSEYHSGGMVAQIPLFFAQTSKEFMGKCDTIRIAFLRDALGTLMYDDWDEDDEEDQEDLDDQEDSDDAEDLEDDEDLDDDEEWTFF